MHTIKLTERQALLCERALEACSNYCWQEFEKDINEFSGEVLTEPETEKLIATLRGD